MDASSMTLTGDDLDKINQYATKKSFLKGEVIFSEGDEADCMYYIESGELSVGIQKFTQQETVSSMKAGDFVGEMAFINGENRSATVTAQTDCILLVISRAAFTELLSEDKELASRINAIVESRNNELADKENLIDNIDHSKSFHLGIKGDPSLRESAFIRERYESVVDKILPQLQSALYELLVNRCIYEVLIHFNSGEVLMKSIFNPLVDEIYPATKLVSKAYINRHFPKVDYNEKIDIARRLMGYLSGDPGLDKLDEINRNRLAMSFKSWVPLEQKDIANTISKLRALRNIPDFYLRNFTISMIRDSIRLQFNCDGTHLLDSESYQVFLRNNLMEENGLPEVDRRKVNRRVSSMVVSSDRRCPPGRRDEDWITFGK